MRSDAPGHCRQPSGVFAHIAGGPSRGYSGGGIIISAHPVFHYASTSDLRHAGQVDDPEQPFTELPPDRTGRGSTCTSSLGYCVDMQDAHLVACSDALDNSIPLMTVETFPRVIGGIRLALDEADRTTSS